MASPSITRLLSPIFRSPRAISPFILRPYPRLPRTLQPAARRLAHTIPKPRPAPPSAPSPSSNSSKAKPRKFLEPHYELTFTCVPCGSRSSHTISKQGYHKGSVLITCPSCRNRHIISDHLNIFGNRKITVEDLMREKGQLVKRGTLGEDGDVEFWEDGTVTQRGGGATSSSSDSTGVKDELDALSEQEAAISREARDTSSQSAEPANRTSTPLSNAGNRPSLDSTPHTNSVPSTRRQYSTNNNYRLDSDDNEADPSGGPPLHSRPTSPLNRVSKEEMIEYAKKHIATKRGIDVDSSPHAKRALGYETRSQPKNGYTDADPMKDGYSSVRRSQPLSHNNEILPRVPVRATKSETEAQSFNIRYFRRRKMRYRDREVTPMKSPTPRIVFSQPTYRGVRFYDIDTVDNRPRYIRTGPGRLKKKRRPLQPNAAARHPLRRLRATSEAHDSKASTKLIRKERARARNSALIEQAVARRSKESNEFIRLPS